MCPQIFQPDDSGSDILHKEYSRTFFTGWKQTASMAGVRWKHPTPHKKNWIE
jgi:hypothetical protein